MLIGRIKGWTRVIGKSQGYLGLPLRDITTNDRVMTKDVPAMESSWILTPEEIEKIKNGAPIILRVLGTGHPPVYMYVGDEPAEVEGQ